MSVYVCKCMLQDIRPDHCLQPKWIRVHVYVLGMLGSLFAAKTDPGNIHVHITMNVCINIIEKLPRSLFAAKTDQMYRYECMHMYKVYPDHFLQI